MSSVVESNTLFLDPKFWPNLDPDQGGYINSFEKLLETAFFESWNHLLWIRIHNTGFD